MTKTLEMAVGLRLDGFRYDFIGAVGAGWQAFRQRRQERRTLIAISRLGPRIIRDIGLDPEQVYEALDGSWDELEPLRLRWLLPRASRV